MTHDDERMPQDGEAPCDHVAAARCIDRVWRPVYQPAAWAPARPGAQDYRRVPSLINGQRHGYRGTP